MNEKGQNISLIIKNDKTYYNNIISQTKCILTIISIFLTLFIIKNVAVASFTTGQHSQIFISMLKEDLFCLVVGSILLLMMYKLVYKFKINILPDILIKDIKNSFLLLACFTIINISNILILYIKLHDLYMYINNMYIEIDYDIYLALSKIFVISLPTVLLCVPLYAVLLQDKFKFKNQKFI